MIWNRLFVTFGVLVGAAAFAPAGSDAQTGDAQSCAGPLTQQLRRFSEKCLGGLVAYVAAQPRAGAKISSERDNYYVLLVKDAKGFRIEAVSKFNYPMMPDETAARLKRLGWAVPENEGDNLRKAADADKPADVAHDTVEALQAYGMKPGDAVSLTVGPDVSS